MPSVKANSVVALQRILAQEGFGSDLAHAGELEVAARAGIDPALISLNGSGKDLATIQRVVALGGRVTIDDVREIELARLAAEAAGKRANVRFRLRPYVETAARMEATGVPVTEVYGKYKSGIPRDDLGEAGKALSMPELTAGRDFGNATLEVEPGRSLFTPCGIHVSTVLNVKQQTVPFSHTWVETDTSVMFLSDIPFSAARPPVLPVQAREGAGQHSPVQVVGRSCAADVLAASACLPPMTPGALLAFCFTGAYHEMGAANFNVMPRPRHRPGLRVAGQPRAPRVRYRTTTGFDSALAKLPREHRRVFIDAVRSYLIPALAAGSHRGDAPWPKRLRVHKIGEVYSLTWSFSGPDGRALFAIGPGTDGDPVLTWLAVGYHDIYQ